MLYVLNIGEDDAAGFTSARPEYRNGTAAGARNTAVTAVCGKIEAELAELPPEEQQEYLASYGLEESGLERLISRDVRAARPDVLPHRRRKRVRAWTIPDE